MNDRETRCYDMFGRVQTFGTDNTTAFASGGEGKKRFANLAQKTEAKVAKALPRRRRGTGRSAGGRAAIGRLIKAGMKEVNYLDAIIHNKYARNPDKLRVWENASHIERAPQREKKPAQPADGTAPPKPPGA